MSFISELKSRRLFFDGAMGTMLFNAGLPQGELPEAWNIDHPEVVQNIHKQYIDAGCDIIKSNTFGANSMKFANPPYTVDNIFAAAINNIRNAANGANHKVFAAADIGPLGKLLKPLGELDFEDAYQYFKQMCVAGEKAGADLILFETFSDTYELKAAILAAKENTNLPVVVTVMIDETGHLLTGGDVAAIACLVEGLNADAFGFNCGVGPDQMEPFARQLTQVCSLPLVFNPNAGLPKGTPDGRTVYDLLPDGFATSTSRFASIAHIMGGCCGTTPEHIAAEIAACKALPLPQPRQVDCPMVSSGMKAVVVGKGSVVIGERINPTGKPKFKQALRDGDIAYILREGINEQADGAHILDVNVGLPEIDEPVVMENVVKELQSVVNLPLQIDTSDPIALERALRIVNGIAMINSVNGKDESLRTVLPLVKKYGGMVVGLTLDENGIPETVEGRVAIAKHIIAEAEKLGINRNRILIDVLTMSISTGQSYLVTIDSLREVKKLGVQSVLGVSNISFGLPERENVNAAFFAEALFSGLDAAIINPHSDKMMSTFYSVKALKGEDPNFVNYIAKYANSGEKKPTPEAAAMTLNDAVKLGLKDIANKLTKSELQQHEPMDIIKNMLIPALDEVGKKFEKGIMFLPQLLMSAEAAESAFAAIKDHIAATGGSTVKTHKIVIATVKGDIHDIGKNIVRVLLDNYGYEVIDLGKDVAPELIVETAIREQVKLVGLSALMTTTVPSMKETIDQLRANYPECKVVVGGAVLTQEYADQIGADAYAPDAMATVNYARKVFGE